VIFHPRIYVVRLKGDNPKLSTALKLVRLGLAIKTDPRSLPKRTLVLDPTSRTVLSPKDRNAILNAGLTVIDASWNKGVEDIMHIAKKLSGVRRILPALKAGNPVNYGVISKLSSAEAIAAALFITGFKNKAIEILNKFKWGHTFLDLNREILQEYSKTSSEMEIIQIQEKLLNKLRYYNE